MTYNNEMIEYSVVMTRPNDYDEFIVYTGTSRIEALEAFNTYCGRN